MAQAAFVFPRALGFQRKLLRIFYHKKVKVYVHWFKYTFDNINKLEGGGVVDSNDQFILHLVLMTAYFDQTYLSWCMDEFYLGTKKYQNLEKEPDIFDIIVYLISSL